MRVLTVTGFQPCPSRISGEVGALVELHDPGEGRLERGHGVVDVVAVQRVPGLEPQRVARAEPARLGAARAGERVPQLLEIPRAAVQLEAVLAGVAGA